MFHGHCPKCLVPPGQLGKYKSFLLCTQRSMTRTYFLADGDRHQFHQACCEAGMKPIVHPFWATLPLVDVFILIIPDILHQMLQGMMKHLIHWLVGIFGPSTINAQCKSIPPNHKIGLFPKGIMILSCVTGQEHKRICGFLLGLIVNLPVPGGLDSSCMVKAACTLLDLLFLAQFQCHTSDTLSWLEGSLAAFHQNKAVFVDLSIWEDFNIPKLHGLVHYALSIHLFGTTDNYNTEQSECLHINLAKNAYRATNCCKVSIVCALGSAHSRPRDACVAVDDLTHQSLTAVPSHAMPPPHSPPPSPLVRCFTLAAMQVFSPTDWDSLLMSLAMPTTVGKRHKTAPASCQPVPHTLSSTLHYSALVWVHKLLDM